MSIDYAAIRDGDELTLMHDGNRIKARAKIDYRYGLIKAQAFGTEIVVARTTRNGIWTKTGAVTIESHQGKLPFSEDELAW